MLSSKKKNFFLIYNQYPHLGFASKPWVGFAFLNLSSLNIPFFSLPKIIFTPSSSGVPQGFNLFSFSLKELVDQNPNLGTKGALYSRRRRTWHPSPQIVDETKTRSTNQAETKIRPQRLTKSYKPGLNINDYQYIKSKWLLELLTAKSVYTNKDYGFIFNLQDWIFKLYGKNIQDRFYFTIFSPPSSKP